MQTKSTKKSMWACGLSVLLCAALLIGTTLAWFTDSVTNKNNKIQSGSLLINAYAYDLAKDGNDFTIDGVNNSNGFSFVDDSARKDLDDPNCGPIISETNWEPGQSSAKLLKVENAGTLATKIKLEFDVSDNGLVDALWFDFVQVDENNKILGSFNRRPMSQLAALAEQIGEMPLSSGASLRFILVYGMDENAGNTYQNKSFSANVSILAKQDTVEQDGFGNPNYDKDATYDIVDVSNAQEFQQAVADGKSVRLVQDIDLPDTPQFLNDARIGMNGKTLTVAGGTGSIKAANGHSLMVYGDGTVNAALYANNNSNLTINSGENFVVNSKSAMGWAVYGAMGSTVNINGGTYNGLTEEGAVISMLFGSNLSIKNATVNVLTNSVMDSYGIQSTAADNYLENVTVNGNYSRAAYFNNANGKAVIRGGSFTTDQKSGEPVNPTISYQGSLDISDATITHIGNGILYSQTGATSVENLTCERCTFIPINNTQYSQIDYKK